MMLYLIKRTDTVGYDEWDSFVVAAHSAEEARNLIVNGPVEPRPGSGIVYEKGIDGKWGEAVKIGITHPRFIAPNAPYVESVEALRRTDPFVVLGSWNAG